MAKSSWVRGKCIGKGAFGFVNLAVSQSDGRVFAVKSVNYKTGLPNQLEALENEIRILKRLSSSSPSPHVVAFLGDDVTCEGEGTSSFKNLHLEYMPGGTVTDMDRADVDERLVRRFAWCLVNALREVHARGVVHCDVKGRNVLVAGSAVKLADFGSAVEFCGGECFKPRGSPMWMAPEVIRREYQGPESDVWSLGCTVIEIFTGKLPWEDRGFDTVNRIGFSDVLPEFPSGLSVVGRDFLEKCLSRDRSRRWSCDQLLQHPFLLPCDSAMESSPRCVLDWVNSRFTESENEFEEEEEVKLNSSENSIKNRIGKLTTALRGVNWETEGWVVVRAIESEKEATMYNEACGGADVGVIWEFENVVRVEEGMEVGSSLEYSDFDERVNREMWKLVWQHECDEWKYNCNRKNSVIGGSGSCCDWSWRCRYNHGSKKFNTIIVSGIFSNYTLCCKIFKSCYLLFSIYYHFWLKRLMIWCLKLRCRLKIINCYIDFKL
ncbi:mitogen-activated protein kinase kinase kinase 18 [Cicer arietinum]|uniref:Mitogen-activated protein kinase kinase kinase 18 n=1 Tax=Cicer arietinum TaxID=3827 RepID=A0A1S2XLS5_CICAR|nr:mitogen-activated protein kinase kinase kinase 18 [Cicer arietinum]